MSVKVSDLIGHFTNTPGVRVRVLVLESVVSLFRTSNQHKIPAAGKLLTNSLTSISRLQTIQNANAAGLRPTTKPPQTLPSVTETVLVYLLDLLDMLLNVSTETAVTAQTANAVTQPDAVTAPSQHTLIGIGVTHTEKSALLIITVMATVTPGITADIVQIETGALPTPTLIILLTDIGLLVNTMKAGTGRTVEVTVDPHPNLPKHQIMPS